MSLSIGKILIYYYLQNGLFICGSLGFFGALSKPAQLHSLPTRHRFDSHFVLFPSAFCVIFVYLNRLTCTHRIIHTHSITDYSIVVFFFLFNILINQSTQWISNKYPLNTMFAVETILLPYILDNSVQQCVLICVIHMNFLFDRSFFSRWTKEIAKWSQKVTEKPSNFF